MQGYKIVRIYQDQKIPSHTVRGMARVSLSDAQAHCKDKETSSITCTNLAGRKRTSIKGDWFDAYNSRH